MISAYHVPEIAIGGEGWNGCVSSCFDVFRGSLRSGQGAWWRQDGRTEQRQADRTDGNWNLSYQSFWGGEAFYYLPSEAREGRPT